MANVLIPPLFGVLLRLGEHARALATGGQTEWLTGTVVLCARQVLFQYCNQSLVPRERWRPPVFTVDIL